MPYGQKMINRKCCKGSIFIFCVAFISFMYVFINGSIRKLSFVNGSEYTNKKLLYSKNNETDGSIGTVYTC